MTAWCEFHPDPRISYYLMLRRTYGYPALTAHKYLKQWYDVPMSAVKQAAAELEIQRLAKIDYRELYPEITEDTFCDSDEWIRQRETRWLEQIETMEKQGGNRRKEK